MPKTRRKASKLLSHSLIGFQLTQFERPPAVIMSGEVWAPNPGALFRSTNHFVDLVFSDDSKQETVLTLQLDKRVYQAAIATLHQLTAKPVLSSAEDAKALPATLRTERTNQKRTLNPRKLAIGPSVALKLAADTDGRMLASVLRDGSVQVWDTETGRAVRRWPAVERNRFDWQRTSGATLSILVQSRRVETDRWWSARRLLLLGSGNRSPPGLPRKLQRVAAGAGGRAGSKVVGHGGDIQC